MRSLPPNLLNRVRNEGRDLSILVIRLGALGDILRTLPAVRLLRRALPEARIDWTADDGGAIPIEERSGAELGLPTGVPVANPGFDVTPARLVTGLITERGVTAASSDGLLSLFPERR